LKSPGIDVCNLIFPNEDVAWVSWKYSEDNVAAGKNIYKAVSAYVTTQSRLKLYRYLIKLGQSVLYCDTDSVIYIQKVDETPKSRNRELSG
jgi:hypothetical protein